MLDYHAPFVNFGPIDARSLPLTTDRFSEAEPMLGRGVNRTSNEMTYIADVRSTRDSLLASLSLRDSFH